MEANKNCLELGDKSSPKDIHRALGLSKKVFKEALGHMYKRRMVALEAHRVELLPMEQWDTGIVASADESKALKAEARKAIGADRYVALWTVVHHC